MKGVLAVFGIILVIFLGAIAYYFFWPQESADVQLEILKPSQVFVGQPFTVEVSFSNYSDTPAKQGKIALVVPSDIAFLGKSKELRVLEHTIGDIGPGSLHKQSFRLVAIGGNQTIKHIEARLGYGTGINPKVRFESVAGADIGVGQPAISLSFDVPQKVFSGENFQIIVNYENNSDSAADQLSLKLEYPPIFQFQESNPKPIRSNNVWQLGKLAAGSRGSITIKGSVIGPEESFFNLNGELSARIDGVEYPIMNQGASVGVARSPLSVSITVNHRPDYIARLGEGLNYAVTYRNNSDVTLENATISATLLGEMFDFPRARSTGSFNSLTNTFFWNAANTPELRSVAPKQGGSVYLDMIVRNVFPNRRISDKNYTLKANVQIESPTVPMGTGAQKTISVSSIETRIGGLLDVFAPAYFRDAASGIVNNGPFPPKANQPTQYTIHWVLRNHATDISNVHVSAFLQSNTKFTGVVKSSIGVLPKHNPASGEITWDIAGLPATKGIIGDPVEAIFQVENVPAVNQIGQRVTLLSDTRVEATDNFVGWKLSASAPYVNTALSSDPTVVNINSNVEP